MEMEHKVLMLYGDFQAAQMAALALRDLPEDSDPAEKEQLLNAAGDVQNFAACSGAESAAGQNAADAVRRTAQDVAYAILPQLTSTTSPSKCARMAWLGILRTMSAAHAQYQVAIASTEVVKNKQTDIYWRAALVAPGREFVRWAIPEVQAYYAVRLRRDFGLLSVLSKLDPTARRMFDEVDHDSPLCIEDADTRVCKIEHALALFRLPRKKLIAQFSVSLSINAFFIEKLNQLSR